jgi:hypothetical protein
MEYTPELAQSFLGKRVVVSVRQIHPDGTESVDAFHGIIESAHEHGLVLRVEGEGDDQYWIMPPDLGALKVAESDAYQMEGSDAIVEGVDYVACYAVADSPNDLPGPTKAQE